MTAERVKFWRWELVWLRARVVRLREEAHAVDRDVFPKAFMDSMEDVLRRFERRIELAAERERISPVDGPRGLRKEA